MDSARNWLNDAKGLKMALLNSTPCHSSHSNPRRINDTFRHSKSQLMIQSKHERQFNAQLLTTSWFFSAYLSRSHVLHRMLMVKPINRMIRTRFTLKQHFRMPKCQLTMPNGALRQPTIPNADEYINTFICWGCVPFECHCCCCFYHWMNWTQSNASFSIQNARINFVKFRTINDK